MRLRGRRWAPGANDRAHAAPVEGVVCQVERTKQTLRGIALGVVVREEEARGGQQMVCDAVGLVVKLPQRLVHAHAGRPGRHWRVVSSLRAKHG
eukprot:2174247-Prymnesium_polylepis.1